MWIADRWNDYQVLDASGGEKLEQWGPYRLIRPDPQVIWNTPKGADWKRVNAHYHRSSKGGGSWDFFDLPETWEVRYPLAGGVSPDAAGSSGSSASDGDAPLTFRLKPFRFKHTGLFPEQAVNWDWFSGLIRARSAAEGRQLKVLNLFAYTGGATLAAAKAGAAVTHVDAAKGMVTWARENAAASGLADAPIRWLVDDCMKFVAREERRGNRYDGIIMDPPSYGRGPGGEVWKLEDTLYDLVCACEKIFREDGTFFLINSYTTGFAPGVLDYLLKKVIAPGRGGVTEADEIGLPVSAGPNSAGADADPTGLYLPCGSSGRWSFR